MARRAADKIVGRDELPAEELLVGVESEGRKVWPRYGGWTRLAPR
jgi:hypothetical protein